MLVVEMCLLMLDDYNSDWCDHCGFGEDLQGIHHCCWCSDFSRMVRDGKQKRPPRVEMKTRDEEKTVDANVGV
ncbi:hypothetical protein QTP88_007391 [Uroleucon formosanum]